MADPKHKNPLWIRVSIIVAAVAIALFAAVSAIEWRLAAKLRQMIGPFATDVRHVRVCLMDRSVTVSGFALRTTDLQSIKRDTFLRSLDLHVERFRISGIGFRRDGDRRRVTVRCMELRAPRVSVERYARTETDTIRNPLHDRLMSLVSSIGIAQIRIDGGYVDFRLRSNGGTERYTLGPFDLRGDGLRIDSATRRNLFDIDQVRFSAVEASRLWNDGTMLLRVGAIALDTRDSTLTIGRIGLEPQKYEKYRFSARVKDHIDWTRVTTGEIRATGIDFRSLMDDRAVAIAEISIDSARIESFKNRKIAQRQIVKPVAWELLHKTSTPVSIRKVNFQNVFAAYEELAADGAEPGRVTFGGIAGWAEGVTNRARSREQYMTISAGCVFQGAGELYAEFRLPADPANDRFEVTGRLGPMDLTAMNPVTEPLSQVRIESGRVNSLDFRIEGSSRQARTSMRFLYDGLEIALMRGQGAHARERKWVSALANDLLIRDANPDRHGRLHEGTGSFIRDPYRSQFNFLWKTLFTGIRSTAVSD